MQTLIEIVLLLVISLNILLSIFVFSQNPKALSNRLFSLLGLMGAIWTSAHYMISITNSPYWFVTIFALGSFILSTGLIWITIIAEKHISRLNVYIICSTATFFFVFSLIPGFIIEIPFGTNQLDSKTNTFGFGLYLFSSYYLICAFLIVGKLYKAYKKSKDRGSKSQFRIILVGSLVSLVASGLTTFVIPLHSISLSGIIDSIGFLIFLICIVYSITRHHLFNIRLMAVQIVTFGLWIFILIRTILAESTKDLIIQSSLLAITVIFGIMLIRGVLREIDQREKLEKLTAELQTLNLTLEAKVAEQTVEIRRSYEVEKKARVELEKLNDAKDQFIMITQHHLRTPVTGIMWQIESILKGVYGTINNKVESAILTMNTSVDRLMTIIDDFLNITAIKSGANILNLTVKSLKPAVIDVLDEIKLEIERMKVAISYPNDDASWTEIQADHPKMREVLLIVIENAVRYNHEGGTVSISTDVKDGIFTMTIENTGIGITKEEHEKIGASLFYRGQRAREAHAIGMGVGLSVVKAMVRAHHGTFRIESGGKDAGAKVSISLPVVQSFGPEL